MKKYLLLLLATATAAGMQARRINPEAADAIASRHFGTVAPAKGVNKAPARHHAREVASPYYLYNLAEGGFVIVSGDDRFGDILGYSKVGSIDLSALPQGLSGLLKLYTTAYDLLPDDESGASTAITAGTPTVVVEPLLGNTNWGQDAPFNTLTPTTTGGKNFYTGCVVAAATQSMRYFGHPSRGAGSKTYTDPLSKNTLTADFSATDYRWDLMPGEVPANPTEEQTKAYSTLATHFGIAVEMQYEAAGSGTYDMLVPYALRNYFGYDGAVRSHQRNYYSTSEWMGMIKRELDEKRPVFYGGTSDTGSGGHAFVIDGYDSESFVHVNWGWYGKSNGYFRINHLDPSSLGIGGGAGGYNLSQDMVTGIQPARTDSRRDYAIYGETRFSADGPYGGNFTMMTYVGNIDVEAYEGRLEGALVKDGRVVATLGGSDISLGGYAGGHSGSLLTTLRNVSATVEGVADGEYTLSFVYRQKDETDWHILRHPKNLPSSAKVIVYNGSISLGEKHTPYPDVVHRSAIATDGDVYAGGFGRVTFSMENLTGDFDISTVTVRLTKVDEPTVTYDSDINLHLYNQSVETVDAVYAVSAAAPVGRYTVSALIKANGKEYPFALNGFEATEINVLATPSTPIVRLVGTPSWQVNNASAAVADRLAQGEFLYVTALFRNAGVAGKARILARLTNTSTGVTTPMIMAETTFSGDKAVQVTFGRQMPQDPGTYTVDFVQVADDYAMTPLVSATPLKIEIDQASNLYGEVVDFSFPDQLAKGQSHAYSLTARGLQTASATLYVRVRQLTNTKGEIVTMKSATKFVAGETVTIGGNYKPSTTLEDALYLVIVEAGPTSAKTVPLGNYATYAKVVGLGSVSGIDDVIADRSTGGAAAIWLDGATLRVVPEQGLEVASVELCMLAGNCVPLRCGGAVNRSTTAFDLSGMATGVYIVCATLSDGSRAVAKLALR